MNPVATSDAAFRGGACPTPEYTIAYTGNYTTSADANRNLFGCLVLNQQVEHVPLLGSQFDKGVFKQLTDH
jgi:hypothetical protein